MSDMHKDCTAITPAMLTGASKNESWLSCFQANTSATVNLSAAIVGSVGELATATLSAVHLFDPVIPRIRFALSGLRKAGFEITRQAPKYGGAARYQITDEPQATATR